MTYTLRTPKVDNGPGYWNSLLVEILLDGTKVGEYTRNYHCMYNTFVPFQREGKWYAVYSKDYTSTRVMSLPDCKDLSGEEHSTYGFCPVDFYVPSLWDLNEEAKEYKEKNNLSDDTLITDAIIEAIKNYIREKYAAYLTLIDSDIKSLDASYKEMGTFGFLSGCFWGDDCSWKIRYLDLSDLNNIKEDDRFGYIEQSENTLKESIGKVSEYIHIKTELCFNIDGKYIGSFYHKDIHEKKEEHE